MSKFASLSYFGLAELFRKSMFPLQRESTHETNQWDIS